MRTAFLILALTGCLMDSQDHGGVATDHAVRWQAVCGTPTGAEWNSVCHEADQHMVTYDSFYLATTPNGTAAFFYSSSTGMQLDHFGWNRWPALFVHDDWSMTFAKADDNGSPMNDAWFTLQANRDTWSSDVWFTYPDGERRMWRVEVAR